MNNAYNITHSWTDNIYLDFLNGTLTYSSESESSESSESDGYDRRLDEDFNRLLKEWRQKKATSHPIKIEADSPIGASQANGAAILHHSIRLDPFINVPNSHKKKKVSRTNVFVKSPNVPKQLRFSENSDVDRPSMNGGGSLNVCLEQSENNKDMQRRLTYDVGDLTLGNEDVNAGEKKSFVTDIDTAPTGPLKTNPATVEMPMVVNSYDKTPRSKRLRLDDCWEDLISDSIEMNDVESDTVCDNSVEAIVDGQTSTDNIDGCEGWNENPNHSISHLETTAWESTDDSNWIDCESDATFNSFQQ